MNADWQTITALGIVAIATTLLIRTALKKRHGRSGGCGCPHSGPGLKIPKHLRRAQR